MFIVRKILKTALMTYLGKYVLNESKLNNLEINSDGKIELKDIELNCSELNQHLGTVGLRVDQFAVKKMNVHVTWGKIVDKLEFDGVIVNLGIGKAKQVEKSKENTTVNPIQNSMFVYTNDKSLTGDSLLTDMSDSSANDNVEGYQAMFDSVDNIKKNFEISVNNTQVYMDSMWFAIDKITFKQGGDGESHLLTLENVAVYNKRMVIMNIPIVNCSLSPSECLVNLADDVKVEEHCSLEHIREVVCIIFKYIKQINKHLSKKDKKETENSEKIKFVLNVKRIYQTHPVKFDLEAISLTHNPIDQSTHLQINSCLSPFISTSNLVANIVKNVSVDFPQNEDKASPFSKDIMFYEDGSKKPESAGSLDQRKEFGDQNRKYAHYHVAIKADKIDATNIKGLIDFCKKISETINESKKIFLKMDTHLENFQSSALQESEKKSQISNETNNNDVDIFGDNYDDDSNNDTNNDTKIDTKNDHTDTNNENNDERNEIIVEESDEKTKNPKFFIEIQSGITNIMLFNHKDEKVYLNSYSTNVFVGDHFWSIHSKHVELVVNETVPSLNEPPKTIMLGTLQKLHLAGTLNADHIVADSTHLQVKNLPKVAEVFLPFMMVESEPMKLKLNIRLHNIEGSEFMLNDTLFYQIKDCEIFANSADSLTCSLQSILVDIGKNYRLFDAKLVHINVRGGATQYSFNRFDTWICATELPALIDNVKHLTSKIFDPIFKHDDSNSDEDDTNLDEDEIITSDKDKKINIVDDYNPDLMNSKIQSLPLWNTLKHELICNQIVINMLENTDMLGSVPLSEIDHLSLDISHMRMYIFKDEQTIGQTSNQTSRVELIVQSFEVRDGIQSSLWNKAVWTGDIKVIYVDKYLSLEFGKEIYLHIDQRLLTFLQTWMNKYNKSYQLLMHPEIDDSTLIGNVGMGPKSSQMDDIQESKPPFKSIHISTMIFRLDYKPQDNGEMFSFVNWLPIRGSKIVFNEFNLFQIKTWSSLTNEFIVNLFSNIQNLQGIVSGLKPVKPIANILSNSKNLLILPINSHIGKKRSESFTKQIKNILKNVTVEVLELGSAMHVNINKHESIYSNQPTDWKEGIESGKKQFDDNCQTMIALVKNGDTDILNIPIVIVRPFTGFMSQFFLGLANQLKPSRKQKMDNKYKTKII